MGCAVSQMVLKQRPGDFAKSLVDSRNLYENVSAIAIFFNHSLKSANLPLDAPEPVQIGCFDLRIDGNGVFPGPCDVVFCFGAHVASIPHGGICASCRGIALEGSMAQMWRRIYLDFSRGG